MKNSKLLRLTALLLAAVMMMSVFAACSKKKSEPETIEPEEDVQYDDFRMIYESIDPDTPVIRLGDVDLNWDITYYAFYQEATKLYAELGDQILDWTAEYQNGDTYISYCMNEAIYDYLEFVAGVDHFAKEYNVELSEESKKALEEEIAAELDYYESEEELNAYMESRYMTKKVDEQLKRSEYLYNDVLDAVTGKNGEKLKESDILEMANTAYKAIKMIPFPISDENGNPVSREDKQTALATAQTVLNELKSVDKSQLDAKFDELITQYGNPEKAEELQGGYVFARGMMDTDLEKAIVDVAENDLCGTVVEGKDNYYVVMRKPIDVNAFPYIGNGQFSTDTLRMLYRDDIFDTTFWDWADTTELEFYPELDNLDVDAVLYKAYYEKQYGEKQNSENQNSGN